MSSWTLSVPEEIETPKRLSLTIAFRSPAPHCGQAASEVASVVPHVVQVVTVAAPGLVGCVGAAVSGGRLPSSEGGLSSAMRRASVTSRTSTRAPVRLPPTISGIERSWTTEPFPSTSASRGARPAATTMSDSMAFFDKYYAPANLVTAIVGGFLISMLGGSRVQIGGPTGAFVVVVAGIVAVHDAVRPFVRPDEIRQVIERGSP